jgi:pectate lyase
MKTKTKNNENDKFFTLEVSGNIPMILDAKTAVAVSIQLNKIIDTLKKIQNISNINFKTPEGDNIEFKDYLQIIN